MTASRIAWVAGFGAGIVLVAVALSAAAGVPIGSFDPMHAPSVSGWHSGWNSNRTSYPVSFNETGLPAGTFWSVQLQGSWGDRSGVGLTATEFGQGWGWPGWNGSKGSTIGFTLSNGTYAFSIGNARNGSSVYTPSPALGTLTVNGSGANVSVAFAPLQYSTVSFVETGLPSGTNWSVGLQSAWSWGVGEITGSCGGHSRGGPIFAWNQSATSTINFTVPNGTYDYHVGPVWTSSGLYLPTPGLGNVTVNGSSLTVAISFRAVALYNVTFEETGLPSGTVWSAAVFNWTSGTFLHGSTNSSSLSIAVQNGTYDFAIGPAWNASGILVPTPHFGNVTVDGAGVTVDVEFATANSNWQVASDPL